MELLERSAVPALVLREERAPMDSLNAQVIVRGRTLPQEISLSAIHTKAATPMGDETQEQAAVRAGAEVVAHALAWQVVLGDGLPMWSAVQWSIHGAAHPQEVLALHQVAQRLSGADVEDVEKN